MAQKSKISSFFGSERGSLAALGGLAGGVAVICVALTVTLVQTNETHADMRRALDAALLSTSRAVDKNHANPTPTALAYLQSYVKNAGIDVGQLSLEARYNPDRSKLFGELRFETKGFGVSAIMPNNPKRRIEAEVTLPVRKRVEFAFALDVSGSMTLPLSGGKTRMDGLQSALLRLFDIVEEEQLSRETGVLVPPKTMISITPYASAVNIGHMVQAVGAPLVSSHLAERAKSTGAVMSPASLPPYMSHAPEPYAYFKPAPKRSWEQSLMDLYSLHHDTSKPYAQTEHEHKYWKFVPARAPGHQDYSEPMKLAPHLWRGAWASETPAARRTQDQPPDHGLSPYMTAVNLSAMQSSIYTTYREEVHKEFATPVQPPLPLTDNFANLRAYVSHFVPYGGTSGHIGMEWAWRTLSPSWAGVWAVEHADENGVFRKVDSFVSQARMLPVMDAIAKNPEMARAQTVDQISQSATGVSLPGGRPYVKGERLPAPYGQRDVQKVLVLMTDGQFGRPADRAAGTTAANSYAYLQDVCQSAKKLGVSIYTIAFTTDAKDHEPLEQCASKKDNFFYVLDEKSLEEAFRSIYHDVVVIRLSM